MKGNETMVMTVQEIAKSYNEAADKGRQVGVLADLNGCDRHQIIVVLKGQGITDIPQPKGRGRKPQEKPLKRHTRVKDTTLNHLILEGISAIDQEAQAIQKTLDEYNRRKELLNQALEMEEYYE